MFLCEFIRLDGKFFEQYLPIDQFAILILALLAAFMSEKAKNIKGGRQSCLPEVFAAGTAFNTTIRPLLLQLTEPVQASYFN